MTKILLAEDDDILRSMTSTILEMAGYQVFAYENGQLALNAYPSVSPDMIVSDITMPYLTGYGLLDAVRQLATGKVVPFLFLSALSERDDVTRARELGADDYVFKPYEPDELITAVRSRLERRRVAELFDTRQAHLQTVILLANIIEARDEYTRGHVERVQEYALELGQALGWSPEDLAILEYGALLHDVGKVSVPEAILNKPTRLTPEEVVVIQQHTRTGAKIIDGIAHLHAARSYILCHHEKWDGSGYPDGLRDERIPREGRLLALADVYDALTSDRSYHKGMTIEEALVFMRREAGKHFDPKMAAVFIKLQEEKLKVM
jgi:putative two-component system response regulator